MTLRVLGLGNELRGDDAAGLLVARRVLSLTGGKARVEEVSDDLEGLVESILEGGNVIVVDALRSPGPDGEVVKLDPDQLGPTGTRSSHGLGLAEAVAIARALGAKASLHVYGIRGRDFSVGASVRPAVALACQRLAVEIASLLEVPSCA